jgi:DNA-binding NarL/FixJ family response regulator
VRVLLVEENLIFREAFRRELLRHFPFILMQEAKDGGEAMEKIQRLSPSLIFMDIGLPGLNGLQLTQKIKKDFPNIRIAMLTGYDFPEYRRTASQYGADRYFLKDSIDWKEVEEFIQSIPEYDRLRQGPVLFERLKNGQEDFCS